MWACSRGHLGAVQAIIGAVKVQAQMQGEVIPSNSRAVVDDSGVVMVASKSRGIVVMRWSTGHMSAK